jgi:glycoside/pentoside/hexuronide:cation symporter, GPH family
MADLSRTRLVAYGGLALPLAALNLPLYVYLPAFYAGHVGTGLSAIGAVLLAARLLDVVTDPVIGELGDRFPTRFGRRRPWLVAAAPLLILATLMLFMPPGGAGVPYLLAWTTLAYLAWTLMLLPYAALGAELSGSYHGRSRITAVREGFVILGILLAAALPALVSGDGSVTPSAMAILAWSMSGLLVLTLAALLALVPEPATTPEPPLSVRAGLALLSANRPFRRLVLAYLLNGIANGLPATLFLLFVANVLAMPDAAGPLLLLYFVAGVAGVPFWLGISYRIGKHRAWCASMLWACLAFAWVPLLGAGDFWPFLVICVLSGLSLGADLALPASMQADVVDLDRLQSGRRRTGLFFAIWSMVTKLALALAVGLAFPLLDLAGFSAAGTNTPGALLTLAALYGLLPVAIKLAATALVWRFPLGADEQDAISRRLVERPNPEPAA